MKDLFGLPMSTIALVLVALFAVALVTVATIAISNRTMFRMGIRNLPRRGTQTGLVVVGLMLSTLIVTAAFTTGDTIDHSLTKGGYDLFQGTGQQIGWNGEPLYSTNAGASNAAQANYANGKLVDALEQQFVSDSDIKDFMPVLHEQAPARNLRSGQAVPALQLAGFDPARLGASSGLTLVDGRKADLHLGSSQVLLSERGARALDAKKDDTLTIFVGGQPHDYTIAGIVKDELSSGILGLSYSTVPGGLAMPINELRSLYGLTNNEVSSIAVTLQGDNRTDIRHSPAAKAKLEAFIAGPAKELFTTGSSLPPGVEVHVYESKADVIEEGELSGNVFTTFFLILGMFSMAAGIMLIFMIFVMLAAERKAEMGMARAVGAQRKHLIQSFISEGMAYSVLAGVVGAALGVLASIGMTVGLLKVVGGDYFSIIEVSITPQSVIIGYTLGVVITFVTVVFASLKVTHVNIVAAIRSLPEERARKGRRKTRWGWVVGGVPAMVLPPLGLWFMLRKGFGLPWTWIMAPSGILLGGYLMMLGRSTEILFPFALGISLIPLSAAALARYFGAPARLVWTLVGVLVSAYWLMPSDAHNSLFGEFASNMEMFVLSGIMIVVSFTLIIVFNARLLTSLFARGGSGPAAYRVPIALTVASIAAVLAGIIVGDHGNGLGELTFLLAGLLAPTAALSFAAARFASLAPALKMAIAYPLSNRFRTGMTVAMFSLIVFSLTVFSILMSNFAMLQGGDSARGGLDVVGTISGASPVSDVRNALKARHSPEDAKIAGAGSASLYNGSSLVRQSGIATTVDQCSNSVEGWCNFPVLAANEAFFNDLAPTLEERAEGYANDAAVLEAVRTNPTLGLASGAVFGNGFSDNFDWVPGVTVKDHIFKPFQVEYKDPTTGKSSTVTIVGGLKTRATFDLVGGLYVNQAAYEATFGTPSYQRFFFRFNDGVDAKLAAKSIQSALAVQGVEAKSLQKLMDDSGAQATAFQRMFQAFMALGLLVGIAGLGVVAFRSVVERRQQIGMLRAIGFQRGTISMAFLLESSFVAIMGILSGVVGGAIIGRNLITSGNLGGGSGSVAFALPWTEIIVMVVAAYAFSLLMTWWPSRGASRVPVAEALRYE